MQDLASIFAQSRGCDADCREMCTPVAKITAICFISLKHFLKTDENLTSIYGDK